MIKAIQPNHIKSVALRQIFLDILTTNYLDVTEYKVLESTHKNANKWLKHV